MDINLITQSVIDLINLHGIITWHMVWLFITSPIFLIVFGYILYKFKLKEIVLCIIERLDEIRDYYKRKDARDLEILDHAISNNKMMKKLCNKLGADCDIDNVDDKEKIIKEFIEFKESHKL